MFLQECGFVLWFVFMVGNMVWLCEIGGEFFYVLIEWIDVVCEQVMFEIYIFCDDVVGCLVLDVLICVVQCGVCVWVIIDGIGIVCLLLFDMWVEFGVEYCIYNCFLFGCFGFLCMYCKFVVIDYVVVFCGGINIVDDYMQGSVMLLFLCWDFVVEMVGFVVFDVCVVFEL